MSFPNDKVSLSIRVWKYQLRKDVSRTPEFDVSNGRKIWGHRYLGAELGFDWFTDQLGCTMFVSNYWSSILVGPIDKVSSFLLTFE
jgi:hypothetical protein